MTPAAPRALEEAFLALMRRRQPELAWTIVSADEDEREERAAA